MKEGDPMKKLVSLILGLALLLSSCCFAEETANPYRIVPEGEEVTISIGVIGSALTEDYENNTFTKKIEADTGLNIKVIPYSSNKTEAVTQLNLDLSAGNEVPDILFNFTMDNAVINQMGEDGYFVDLLPLMEEYCPNFWTALETIPEASRYDIVNKSKDPTNGAMYCFPTLEDGTYESLGYLGQINKAWLDKLELEMPTTVEELYNVLTAFRNQDPNGNGIADEIPLLMQKGGGWKGDIFQWIINAFVFTLDDTKFNVTDGQLWVPYTTDEYRQAMIYMNKLFKEGLLSDLCFTANGDAEVKALVCDDNAVLIGIAGGHPALENITNHPNTLEYVAIPVLKDATGSGRGGSFPKCPAKFSYGYYVTTSCEHPEIAAKLLNYFYDPFTWANGRYGVQGENWDVADEGATDDYGIPAIIKVIDDCHWTTQNSVVWHSNLPNIGTLPRRAVQAKPLEEGTWNYNYTHMSLDIYANYEAAPQPAELFTGVILNADQNNLFTEKCSGLWTYMKEARALMVSGVLDPNSDADWQTYLNNMEANGLSTALQVYQEAYDLVK